MRLPDRRKRPREAILAAAHRAVETAVARPGGEQQRIAHDPGAVESRGDDAKGRAETALGFPPKSRSTGWGLFPPDLHVRVLEDTLNPVALPPRRAKVSTKPSLTGSVTCVKTIGMDLVCRYAAARTGAEPVTIGKASPSITTSPNPSSATVGATLKDALAQLLLHDARYVAVVDGDRSLGVLTADDLHAELRKSLAEDDQ